MATLAEIRARFPDAYKDVPDQQLADAIYAKHYAGKDRREFDARIGLKPYQNTAEATGTALQNAPTRVQMGVTGLQQMTAEGQSDNFTALQSAPPEDLAVDANFQNYAAENGLDDLTAAASDPVVREAFFQSAGMDAAKRAVGAALTYQQQTESLKPIDVSAGSLDYYISGAIGSTAEMLPALVASVITKNPTPGVAMIMGQSAGQNYGKGRMEGLDPGRAREYAALMSSAEAIPSFLPLGQFLSAGAGNLAIDLGKGALAEAFQEGLTQALQIGIDQGYLSPEMTMGEALNQIKDAAIMGAIAGTMMDAGVRGSEKASSELYKGIYAANEAGKAFIQQVFPKTEQVAAPAKPGPTMLDRVNQALQRKGFAPIVPLPTEPEIAITGEQPDTTAAPPATATSEAAGPPADGAAPTAPAETAPPATAVEPGAVSAVDQIITIESGGNPTAQNPNGSAGGLGGFIDSTWIATVRNNAPELAGESDAQILARKKDATPEGIAFQRRMVEAHIGENSAALQANGIEPTPGNIYAAHFLGSGGANTVLKAPDATPIANLVSQQVMDSNPFLKGMTVADFKAWTDKKMGGAGVSAIVPGGAAPAVPGSAAATTDTEAGQVAAPTIPTVESGEFDTAPAEPVQRAGGVPADAQAEADLIETSKQQRAIVEAGQGVLAPPATTGATPAPIATAADLANVAKDVNPDPTPAQIEAGNYRKAHVELNGFNISIENPRGSIRRGTDTDGKAWEVTMPADYGYIKRTTGADGEQVDVYIGQHPESPLIFVVDQIDPDSGDFDEHKVIMGAQVQGEAELIYRNAFSDKSGAKRMGSVTAMDAAEFKAWLANGDPKKPVGHLGPKPPRLTGDEGTLVVRSKSYQKVFGKTTDTNNPFYAHPESPVAQERAQGWADGKAGLPPQKKPHPNGPDIKMGGYNPINPYLEGYIGGRYGDAFQVRAFDAPGTYRALLNGTFDKDPTPQAPKPGELSPELIEVMDKADKALNGAAADAISQFVGHGPKSRDKDWSQATGIMYAHSLEAAARGDDPAIARELVKEFKPVRAAIEKELGSTVKLYRVQRPVEKDPNVINGSVPADGRRAVLSWTMDEKFARAYAGVHKSSKITTEAEIKELERKFDADKRVRINKRTELVWEEVAPGISTLMIYTDGEAITDTDSVRAYVEGQNEWLRESNASNDKRAEQIVSADVPLDAVIWATHRANQAEFIVRNEEGSGFFIDTTGKLVTSKKAPADGKKTLTVELVDGKPDAELGTYKPTGNFVIQPGQTAGQSARELVVRRGKSLEKGESAGTEFIVTFGPKGELIANGMGINRNVGLNAAMIERMPKPDGGMVAHHNHPSSSSFSAADISNAFAPGLAVLWAHGHDGVSYRLEVPEAVKRMHHKSAQSDYYHVVLNRQNRIKGIVADGMRDRAVLENWDNDTFGRVAAHMSMLAWRDAGLIAYDTDYKLPEGVEGSARYRNTMKEAVDALKRNFYGDPAHSVDRPTGTSGLAGDVGTVSWRSDEAAKDGPSAQRSDQGGGKPDRGKAAKAKAEPQGEVITVTTPTGGKVQVRPEVVTIESLQKATGDLQPRDRSRAASDAQIEDMAINLDPDRLLPSTDADRGAPIVGPDGIVESGNGRVQALRRAAEAYPEKYLAYIKAMKAAGHKFNAVEGTPIVIMRRVTEMTPAERVEFVTAANTSAIARMSATEQALVDAKAIDASVLDTLQPGVSPMAPGSKFAQAFLGKLPQAERAALADRNGVLNADGVRRIQSALLAAAYGDASTVAKAAENVDDNARSITGAMTDVAPEWLGMRRDIEAAGVSADYDMTDALMGALKLLDTARTKAAQQSRPVKALINEAVDQIDMLSGAVDPVTIEMVRAFYSEGFGRAKSRADIAAFLASITTEVQSAIQPQLLGAAPTPGEVIHGARRRSEKQAEQQGDIFASRAPRGRVPASREADRERSVPSASAQDQQRAGAAPVAGRELARVGGVSGSAEQAAIERAESVSQDRSGTAADRSQADAELDALGVDTPMPGYVPMYVKKGVPDRPANDRIKIGNREFELPPLDRPQRREGIRVQLEGIIGPRLYVGKIKGQSMLGFYRKSNSEVRTKNYDDIEVMAHEMAHYLDFHYTQAGKFTASYKGRKDVKDLSYTSAPRNVEKEGFAEFVRLWLTQYDEAARAAPAYVREFEKVLATDPALDRQMHKLQEHMHKWFLQGPHAQLRAKSGEEYTPTEQWMQFVQSYPLEKARQNIIDNIHAAKVVERVTTGEIGDATKSAYKQFQMANGAESTYSAVVEFGTPVLDVDGSLQFGGESLMQVFWPVAKHGWKRFDLLMDYFKARRGKELLGQGREKLFTPQEIKAGLKLGQQYPEFAGVFGAYQKFNQRMLDWYVSMDLITEAQRDAFGEANKSYVPFHRITKMIAEGGASAGSGIGQRLAGGTANTRDIAVNIIEGLYSNVRGAMIARAKATMYKQIMASQDGAMFAVKIGPDSKKVTVMLGEQARKVAQVMAELGIGISSNGFIVNEPAVDNAIYDVNEIAEVLQQRPELLDFWLVNQPPKTDGDTYVDSAIIDGEKVYFEVREPLLVDMLTGMGGMQMGAVLRAFMSVKNIQTRAVTVMPQFMIPNLVRDTLSAMALSKNKFLPVATSLRGMWDTVVKSDTFKEFMLNGGGYGNSVEARTAETRTRRQLDLPAQTGWDHAAKMLAGWDRISSSFEYGTRVGDYRLSRKAGRSPTEAAWQAREISTDFSKIGRADIWAKFLRTVPFANAGIQGLDKTARELAEIKGKMTAGNLLKLSEAKAKFLLRGSILTVATLALWLLNNDDERYKALTDDERSRFWWIYLPGTKAPLKIPRPYDIGYIFASIPELMLNYAKDRDGKAAASQLAWIAINSTPVGEWPGLLQPIMEAQANKDWRGAAIVPEYMASREPRYQYNERTPIMYRKMGELLGVSPLMAEHYAQGYLRYVEQIAADATEALLWKRDEWGEKPFARSPVDYATFQFTGREVPFRTKWTDGYYELKRRAEGAQSAFSALKAEALHNGEPLQGFLSNETNTALVTINRMFGRMDRQLATGADMVMAITYDPNLTREQKEAKINAWYAQKNAAMAGMFEQVDTMLKDIATK